MGLFLMGGCGGVVTRLVSLLLLQTTVMGSRTIVRKTRFLGRFWYAGPGFQLRS